MIMLTLALSACLPDDVDGDGSYDNVSDADTDADGDTDSDADGDTDTDTDSDADTLVGAWLSEGDDLSELFAPYYTKITADFAADGSYLVVATDTDGGSTDFIGTWTDDTSTDPATIQLVQTSPSNATSEGIYAVDGDVLTYEVVIVTPSYGYTPPTPEGGFGSSSGPRLDPGVNVQTYRRQ